jgi:hypothetical protein
VDRGEKPEHVKHDERDSDDHPLLDLLVHDISLDREDTDVERFRCRLEALVPGIDALAI